MFRTIKERKVAIEQLNYLIKEAPKRTLDFIKLRKNKYSFNRVFKTSEQDQRLAKDFFDRILNHVINYLKSNGNRHGIRLLSAKQRLDFALYNHLLVFFNLKPNRLLESLIRQSRKEDVKKYLNSHEINVEKFSLESENNKFKNINVPLINFDRNKGAYTSPDDHLAHKHGKEAIRIFFSTQWERFKSFLNRIFSKLKIHVFESSTYKERDYLETDIYAIDKPFNPYTNKAQYYWVGHATNLITIPQKDNTPITILTDPVEGDINKILYPRMTKEGRLINGELENKLPKIDIVLISHNHRDHVSTPTLKKLLPQQPKMIVPEGDEKLFRNIGFQNVQTLKWWKQDKVVGNQTTNALLSSMRSPFFNPSKTRSQKALEKVEQTIGLMNMNIDS